jgi:hypothetical protein
LPMIWLVTIEKPHFVDERDDCASAPVGSSTARGAHQRPGGEDHVR